MYTDKYRVLFETYSKGYYGQLLHKNYGERWLVTRKALVAQFARVDRLVLNRSGSLSLFRTADNKEWIIDYSFKIAGSAQEFGLDNSSHGVIAYANHEQRVVRVLAFYPSEDPLSSLPKDETAALPR